MKILVVSDVHKSVDLLFEFLQSKDVDACISCGDLTETFSDDPDQVEIPKPIHSVYGNHENWKLYGKEVKNLHWITAGKVYDILGLKVSGMGGVESNSPQYPSHYTQGEVEASKDLSNGKIDIFVAHHPPRMFADFRLDIEKNCGSFDTQQILYEVEPKLFIAGHLHWLQTNIYGDKEQIITQVVTLGKFKHGDYGLLTEEKFSLYKNHTHFADIFWQSHY